MAIPGEYKYWFGIETAFGAGLFVLYEAAILRNRLKKRIAAWGGDFY